MPHLSGGIAFFLVQFLGKINPEMQEKERYHSGLSSCLQRIDLPFHGGLQDSVVRMKCLKPWKIICVVFGGKPTPSQSVILYFVLHI